MRNLSEIIDCHFSIIAIFFIFLPHFINSQHATLLTNQTLTNNQTIVSSGKTFELGFFNPDKQHWYVGIWYKNIPDTDKVVVWVANRNSPLTNPSGVLKIGENGNILILLEEEKNNPIIWSTNLTLPASPMSRVAELLDTGNFILREENNADPYHYLWQSFDYPTDTLLPEMKLGWDLKTGFQRYLTSWKTLKDPSSGDYSFRIDPHGYPETFLMKGDNREYRSGAWNGVRFTGIPDQKPLPILNFNFEANQDEVYYSFTPKNHSILSRLVVNASTGVLQRFVWQPSGWNLLWKFPKDKCDTYARCGNNGVCNPDASPACQCVKGFEPRNLKRWHSGDISDGCVRKVELDCESDGFSSLENIKLPESSSSFVDQRMNITECEMMCRNNCSCTAYTYQDISDPGRGCVIWIGSLLDTREYAEGGQSIFIRMPSSLLKPTGAFHAVKIVAIVMGAGILMCGIAFCVCKRKELQSLFIRRQTLQEGSRPRGQDFLTTEAVVSRRDPFDESKADELELPLFNFSCVALATDEFSGKNKIGEGGFGCVYKGTLADEQEVAIKRLSKTSGQGTEEFMNEVKLIARLQHRNLVRLLGCCIERDEKMLIYEYLPHRSLDNALFCREKRPLLDWKTRFGIICGIARGLLYLHQDSRYRIIHRDLKASNVLLDSELCPKISDFGLARIFGKDQTEANTKRVIGTYGYMAPEYAMDGIFSVKSDVYSFGVLVLEIVSGRKNRGFYSSNYELNLLGHAWNLWKEQKGLDITDPSLFNSYSIYEVLRCIQIGLLCVQERAEDRPKMSSVVLMLSSETAIIPQPKPPGFCLRGILQETDSSSSKQEVSCTVNQVTLTVPDGR